MFWNKQTTAPGTDNPRDTGYEDVYCRISMHLSHRLRVKLSHVTGGLQMSVRISSSCG